MIFIPLPLFLTGGALVLMILILTRIWLGRGAKLFFSALMSVIAVETILVALRFAYQIEDVLVLQRLLPFWIGPLLYLGFVMLSDRASHGRKIVMIHLGAATVATIAIASFPPLRIALDLVIGLSYAFYAIAMIHLWRGGPDRLSQLPVVHVPKMRRLLVLGILLLVLTCVLDTVIAIDFATNAGQNVTQLLSAGTLAVILIFAVALLWVARTPRQVKAATQNDESEAVVMQATQFLQQSHLFTDPDLSLTRLARRIGVTDRVLSMAINRHTGRNVSQFINGFRLTEAAHLLRTTADPVGTIGETVGFLTRSNFYTEFQRAHGQSPGAYRKGNGDQSPETRS